MLTILVSDTLERIIFGLEERQIDKKKGYKNLASLLHLVYTVLHFLLNGLDGIKMLLQYR
jgi:hypothetical protein